MAVSMLFGVLCCNGGQVALDGVDVEGREVEPVEAFLVNFAAMTEAQQHQKRMSNLLRGANNHVPAYHVQVHGL